MLNNFKKERIDIEGIAKKALKDKKLLAELLENLWSKNETIRYNSHKELLFLNQEHPTAIYPKWDYLTKFLDSDNTYHKLSAIHLLANLTKADKDDKFEKMFDRFYNLLNDRSFITATYVAGASGKIAMAKPKLRTKITNKLLSIDKTHYEQERKDLVKAGAIEAFEEYFEQARNKKQITEFVQKQLKSQSPKTRKKANEFLERLNKPTK